MDDALDELFHVASRNLASTKQVRAAHLIHYAPHIVKLATDAPLRSGKSRGVRATDIPELTMTLEEVLATRRSSRAFSDQPLTSGELWKVCFAATGVRHVVTSELGAWYQRNAPNSGGMGSVEAFPVVLNVAGVAPGIYHFDSIGHEFAVIEAGDFKHWLCEDVLFQAEFGLAAAAIVLVGVFKNLRSKYGVRGYRSSLIDAGHASENAYLAATALGLAVCATTGFVDDELDEGLRLDGVDMASLVVILVGRPGRQPSGQRVPDALSRSNRGSDHKSAESNS
jgi:SagB-type dehydrogenase family enzyme